MGTKTDTQDAGGSDPRAELARMVEEDPLAHPLAFEIRHFDHAPAPPHLRELMGAVFRSMSPRYPHAPRRLARFYPREHGKSEIGTVLLPVWAVARDRDIRILIMSETTGQAVGKLKEARGHLDRLSDEYGINFAEDHKRALTVDRGMESDVPTIQAAGFDTGVTGGHYDMLVFDDVVSWKTQRTEKRREKAWSQASDYFQNLGSGGDSTFLVLGTRKHENDLYSRLMGSFGWDTKVDKALSDWTIVENREFDLELQDGTTVPGDELHRADPEQNPLRRVIPHRDVDVLWPERWPLESLLENLVSSMTDDDGEGTLIWKRENQNDAGALMGQVLGEGMLTFVESVPDQPTYTYAGVDLGVEDDPEKAAKSDSDYWAVAVGEHAYEEGVTYVRDVKRRRGMTLNEGIDWVKSVLSPYSINRAMVESNQAQRWFSQQAREDGLRLRKTSSSGKKEDRIIDMSSRFESGRVRLVEGGTGWSSFVQEWASFPTGAHDDMLDAVEILLRNVGTDTPSTSSRSMNDLPLG